MQGEYQMLENYVTSMRRLNVTTSLLQRALRRTNWDVRVFALLKMLFQEPVASGCCAGKSPPRAVSLQKHRGQLKKF